MCQLFEKQFLKFFFPEIWGPQEKKEKKYIKKTNYMI